MTEQDGFEDGMAGDKPRSTTLEYMRGWFAGRSYAVGEDRVLKALCAEDERAESA